MRLIDIARVSLFGLMIAGGITTLKALDYLVKASEKPTEEIINDTLYQQQIKKNATLFYIGLGTMIPSGIALSLSPLLKVNKRENYRR